jgi:hypothetical protein
LVVDGSNQQQTTNNNQLLFTTTERRGDTDDLDLVLSMKERLREDPSLTADMRRIVAEFAERIGSDSA